MDDRKDPQNLQPPPASVQEDPFHQMPNIGLVSGESPRFSSMVTGHKEIGEQIRNLGLVAHERHGRYGTPEKSWLVFGPSREQMYELGKQFGQEAVVFSSGGQHELLYTNGPNAGKYHPAVGHEWFHHEPDDYYTHFPELNKYLRLNFDGSQLLDSKLGQTHAIDALQARANPPNAPQQPLPPPPEDMTKAEIAAALARSLRKAIGQMRPAPHPHAYDWHGEHTDHHFRVMAPGVVISMPGMAKADGAHPHMDGSKPPSGTDHLTAPVNDQAAGVGVSTYGKFAMPYGTLDKNNPTDLFHYPYHNKNHAIDQLVKDHGYSTYYAGGKYGRPDLGLRNYNTKHLMVYDPSPGSGGDFGTEAYTDGWRKIHELSHALVYPELNKIYGEGRRIGKLGHHRTLNEALRAVHWEWLAAHKQRELSQQIGVHVPDHVFHKELNTVMHDAVHRAVTGKFTEPSGEGYRPHEHKVPLETALGMVRESAHNLGVTGMHDLIKKSEGTQTMADDKEIDWNEARKLLAKSIKSRVEEYTKGLVELRQRELKKNLAPAGPAPEMTPVAPAPAPQLHAEPAPTQLAPPVMDPCPMCGMEDKPGACVCLGSTMGKNDTMGYPQVSAAGTQMVKAELCKSCGKEHMDKCGLDEIKSGKDLGKGEKKPDTRTIKCGKCGTSKPRSESGANMCNDCFDKQKDSRLSSGPFYQGKPWQVSGETKKAELSTKAKEPIKPAKGNGIKIKSLKKDGMPFGQGQGKPGRAQLPRKSVAPTAVPAALAGQLGMGPKPTPNPTPNSPVMHGVAQGLQAKRAGTQLPGAKPPAIAPVGGAPKAPGMGAVKPPPPAGTAHLSPPPAAAPAAAPKAPAAPQAAAPAAAPKTPAPQKPLGKSESFLGQCALCAKPEHNGECS